MAQFGKQLPRPFIIAHRGCSSDYPENTLAAFAGAIDAGAHMVELDVCFSRDRHPVVMHDDTVDRTTNAAGPVNSFTMEQLGSLDAGSWFAPRFCAEAVPSLSHALDLMKGRVHVNIEIKPDCFEEQDPADAIERQVLSLVREKGMDSDVLVSSFEWQLLDRIRILDSEITLGLISDMPADDSLIYWYRRVKGFSWHPDYRILTRVQVDTLHELGARVFPYGVNGKIDIEGMLAMGVDGLILDNPHLAVSP
jgi:glycerophosphoryl diester phosphodiesterase